MKFINTISTNLKLRREGVSKLKQVFGNIVSNTIHKKSNKTFSKFFLYQTGSSKIRRHQGSGLAVCKEVIGKIRCENKEEKETAFCLLIHTYKEKITLEHPHI